MTDRLDLANAFEGAGIERRAAERLADEVFAAIRENVATKAEVDGVRNDIAGLRGEMVAGDASLRQEIMTVHTSLYHELAGLRGEMAAGDAALRTEIVGLRGEMQAGDEKLRGEIRDVEIRLTRAMMTQTWTILGGVAAIVAIVTVISHLIH